MVWRWMVGLDLSVALSNTQICKGVPTGRGITRGLKRMSTVGSWDVKVTSREAFSIMYAAPFCSPAAQAKAVQMSALWAVDPESVHTGTVQGRTDAPDAPQRLP